ncbi:hypothetical protein AAG570_002933 [Ranatra chinensis]|uniref:Uncharacterized protein n=1 Tax=Ranatra chinensis TaxID=642074 RepID=A0ABD0YS24_9HEMI
MASKSRNMFYQNKKQETMEIEMTRNKNQKMMYFKTAALALFGSSHLAWQNCGIADNSSDFPSRRRHHLYTKGILLKCRPLWGVPPPRDPFRLDLSADAILKSVVTGPRLPKCQKIQSFEVHQENHDFCFLGKRNPG